jgi:hypothetical protein
MFPTPRNYRAAYLIKYTGGYTDKLTQGKVSKCVEERNILDFTPSNPFVLFKTYGLHFQLNNISLLSEVSAKSIVLTTEPETPLFQGLKSHTMGF